MRGENDRGRLTAPYQDALKKYAQKYLQSRIIYGMCHVPDIFFGWLMPKDRPPVLCRNSDGKKNLSIQHQIFPSVQFSELISIEE